MPASGKKTGRLPDAEHTENRYGRENAGAEKGMDGYADLTGCMASMRSCLNARIAWRERS